MEKTAQSPIVTRKPYPSDLTDAQWDVIQPMIVLPEGGAPRTTDLREVINGMLYQLRSGCAWDMLPHAP